MYVNTCQPQTTTNSDRNRSLFLFFFAFLSSFLSFWYKDQKQGCVHARQDPYHWATLLVKKTVKALVKDLWNQDLGKKSFHDSGQKAERKKSRTLVFTRVGVYYSPSKSTDLMVLNILRCFPRLRPLPAYSS